MARSSDVVDPSVLKISLAELDQLSVIGDHLLDLGLYRRERLKERRGDQRVSFLPPPNVGLFERHTSYIRVKAGTRAASSMYCFFLSNESDHEARVNSCPFRRTRAELTQRSPNIACKI
jgi:hypothetical protein